MWEQFKEQMKQLGIQRELEDELRTGIQLEYVRAEQRQRKLAEAARRRTMRTVDGLGHMSMVMDPFLAAMANVKFGPGWRKDKKQVADLRRQNPEFFVHREKKAMVTVLKPE